MKKYLREIEVSGVILTAIGIICTVICLQFGNESASNFGLWACGLGLILIFSVVIYKAFHWKEYERDNKRYIFCMLFAIAYLIIRMLLKR